MSLSRSIRSAVMLALAFGGAGLLAGCEDTGSAGNYKAFSPIPEKTLELMAAKGTVKDAPMLIRAYKKEAEFEVWKRKADGSYVFLKTFPMCRWSGQLGPKVTEGDRQVPEGFYTITPGQMNPNSHYYLSMNVGYPNAYDRANGHTGGSIMVHGICSSAGCFSMTDKQIEEIYALARESFAGGQRAIQMQSYPFRMTAENLAKLRLDPNMPFWRELKKGSDYFEVTKTETPVGVCNRHYVFGATPKGDNRFDALSNCPPVNEDAEVKTELTEKEKRDDAEVAALVAKGVKPVRIIYADGGQNPEFTHQMAEVSRPDALAAGPTEIALDEGVKAKSVVVQIAAAKAQAKALLAKGNVISPVGPAAIAVAETGSIKTAPTVAQGTRVAQAEQPATFAAAPSAYAKTEPKDESQGFFKKWLSFGAATKPEAAPAIAVSEPASPQPANVPLPPRRTIRVGAGKTTPAPSAVPAKPEQLSSALPKEITGETPALPKQLLALLPNFN
jgi:murein L,D-transpeptidase YafK